MEKEKINLDPNKINTVCNDCGEKYGRHKAGIATFYEHICDICHKKKVCTEIRDYGYLANDTRKKLDI